jgi:hypothetical protein
MSRTEMVLTMNAFISHLSGIDLVFFHAINRFCGQSLFLDQIVSRLESA